MFEDPMVAWTMVSRQPAAEPEIAVYADGRLRLAPRLGGGERHLSTAEVDALRRFVFDQQGLLEVDQNDLANAVDRAAAERRREAAGGGAAMVTGATMDAGTTVLRVDDGTASREYRYHDLAGDAAAYPEAEALQRLRAVETRLLELARQP